LRYELWIVLNYVAFKDADFKLLFLYYSYLPVAMTRLRVFLVENAIFMDFAVHAGQFYAGHPGYATGWVAPSTTTRLGRNQTGGPPLTGSR